MEGFFVCVIIALIIWNWEASQQGVLFRILVFACASFILGIWFGWLFAHRTVATECERLGVFYVGARNFSCSVVGHERP